MERIFLPHGFALVFGEQRVVERSVDGHGIVLMDELLVRIAIEARGSGAFDFHPERVEIAGARAHGDRLMVVERPAVCCCLQCRESAFEPLAVGGAYEGLAQKPAPASADDEPVADWSAEAAALAAKAGIVD